MSVAFFGCEIKLKLVTGLKYLVLEFSLIYSEALANFTFTSHLKKSTEGVWDQSFSLVENNQNASSVWTQTISLAVCIVKPVRF